MWQQNITLTSLLPLDQGKRREVYREARHQYGVFSGQARDVPRPHMLNTPPDYDGHLDAVTVAFGDWTVAAIMAGVHDDHVLAGTPAAISSSSRVNQRIAEASAARRKELT